MDTALAQLIKISNITGKDPALVQGGGGNTSVKTADGKYMYIKASGTALKEMDKKTGWRRLRLDAVRTIIIDKSVTALKDQRREVEVVNRLALACDDSVTSGARPSVEAHLHAFLDKCVIHLHPNVVGAFVNAKNGKARLDRLFKEPKLAPLWVPYTDPGFMLAKKIAKLIKDYQNRFAKPPAILFLEKHGLFVTAKTPDAALKILRLVINRCSARLIKPKTIKLKSVSPRIINDTKLAIRGAFFNATGQYSPISYFYDSSIASFMKKKNAPKMLSYPSLAPDELVYANGPAMWLDKCDPETVLRKLTDQIKKSAKPSIAFLVNGVGLFVAVKPKTAPVIRDIMATSFFVRLNASAMGGITTLNKRQQDFINQWEAEAFRKSLVTGSAEGQLKDRIAVVTGAGSGIGRSIAVGLARAGAYVALADIDTKAAQQTTALIEEELPGIPTMVLGCNVTSTSSVDKAFESLLTNFGGLDILVNAAGIAPPYPLVDLPVEEWRLALEVNLTGYFLMAQAAAKIMIRQSMAGNIINISSKSGIEASKNNTPYNATKAGEIHMARGWAMELGVHGIRVNSVAPGNVFEGSKIWNPEYMKVCAKKYGIKPDEVIQYYMDKTALKKEIKGRDIADSVVFLCSDKARRITGQTLVPDSGQVMVR